MVKPEGVPLTAEPEGSVAGKPPVARPVLHVHGQLVEGLVVDVGEGPDEDVSQPELPVKVPEADLVTNHSSVFLPSDQSQLSITTL